jgi:hypothetical protein
MTKKWIAVNLILLLCAGLLGWQLQDSVKRFKAENDLAAIQPTKKKSVAESGLPPMQLPRTYGEPEFAAIYAQNLFAESRKLEENVDTSQQPVTKPLPSPPPILVGIIISGSQRLALINDPNASRGNSVRRTQTMRLGDTYQDYVVTDITDNSMILEYGPNRQVVPLSDTSKPAQAGKTPILQTRVVNFGGAASGAASMAAATGLSSRATSTSNPAGAGRANPQGVVPVQQQGARGANQAGQPVQQQMQANPGQTFLYQNQFIDAQGRVQTATPFGLLPQQSPVQAPPASQQPVKK